MSISIERSVERALTPAPGAPGETEKTAEPRAHGEVPFHLSLNVADLAHGIDFFRRLFDLEPAKQHDDYAKFEVASPPLVLSLEPNEASAGARLNHLGIRLPNAEQLVALQRRLEMAGIACQREEGVACCYSRQTKFWVADPDGNPWEIYTLEADLDCRGIGGLPIAPQTQPDRRQSPAPAVWVHRLGEPIAERLLVESGTVDQVLLQGSFNVPLDPDTRRHLLAEVRRVLKPGGQLTMHGLSADQPVANIGGRLPGPAAAVRFVPAASELIAEVEAAEFESIQFSKLDDDACFTIDGHALHETRIVGFRPSESSESSAHAMLYKGPFRTLHDDAGRVFHRGQWTAIDAASWEQLQASPISDQFLFRDGSSGLKA